MIKLRINNTEVKVTKGTSVLEAARKTGVEIPTMCYYKDDFSNHPSCMVCLVKDNHSGKLLPSCALPVAENMDISTNSEEIIIARKEALELLLSDHVGDCDAPCRLGCPAYMDIPLMNRLIAKGEFQKAIAVVKEEIPIPHILGYICPAPCEKVCRRSDIDRSVAICQLKKFVAAVDLNSDKAYCPNKLESTGKKVAIIGSGPAGLSAAFILTKAGHECVVFDKNEQAGGSLRYKKMDKPLPIEVLDSEINFLKSFGVEFKLSIKIDQSFYENTISKQFDALILCTGSIDESKLNIAGLDFTDKGIKINPETYQTSVSSVFACGSAIRNVKMAVRSLAQAKEAAKAVDRFLKDEAIVKTHRMFNSRFGKLLQEEYVEYLKESPNKNLQKGTYTELRPFAIKASKKEAERCMHCDCRKLDHCALRIHADHYKVDRKRYAFGERNKVRKYFKQDVVVYEPEKCIKCGLCVEVTCQYKEKIGFTHIGRGFDVKIKAPFGKSINEALTKTAEKCARVCPTGAISLIEDFKKIQITNKYQ